MTKIHTFAFVWDGTGAAPSPWVITSLGGGSPDQGGGVLHFPGVHIGGANSSINAPGVWDLSFDSVLQQWGQIVGISAGAYMQLTCGAAGLFSVWYMEVLNGLLQAHYYENGVTDHHVIVDAPFDSRAHLVWQIQCHADRTTTFTAGPDAQSVLLRGTTPVVPLAYLQDIETFEIGSRSTATFEYQYGETQALATNAYVAPSAGLTSSQDQVLQEILGNTQGGTFKFPLIGLLQSSGVAGGPFIGGTVYDLPFPLIAILLAGLTWEMTGTPPHVGGEAGVITEGKRRAIQVVVFHNLLGGTPFADQTFNSDAVTGTCWFDSPDPSGVSVYIAPGYTADLSWLGT